MGWSLREAGRGNYQFGNLGRDDTKNGYNVWMAKARKQPDGNEDKGADQRVRWGRKDDQSWQQNSQIKRWLQEKGAEIL
jgi:hypothetical protein